MSLNIPITVRDLSVGGMAIESAIEFPLGVSHDFQLTLGDGSLADLVGRVRYSRNISPAGATAVYLTGVEFVDEVQGDASVVTTESMPLM